MTSRPVNPPAFDICGPLPSGVTLLEASAGTGKTYTIAALVARYVASGIALDHLLVVTFTRMATSELRERVRDRLVDAEEGLTRVIAGASPPDGLVALLATGSVLEVDARRERLAAAVAGFDAATIETTHGFCLRVLTGLGVAGDVEPDTTLEPDVADMLDEVVDDLYVRKFWPHDRIPAFPRSVALDVGRAVAAHPDAVLAPPRTEGNNEPWALRRRLADAVRAELERRKRAAKVLTYDDVLLRLRATLADPVRGPAASERLRTRYQVALIDEFQDTDPVQWDIVRRAFGAGDSTLVLIGDPKQAIYAFRGADVHAYLDAAAEAQSEATLGVNWRSDQALLDAYDALLGGSRLGEEAIFYREVRAARPGARLAGVSPLRIRLVPADGPGIAVTGKLRLVTAPSARTFVANDVAADISRVLRSEMTVPRRSAGGDELGSDPVRPGHIAVLVRTNVQAEMVRSALHAAAVPAVVGGSASVFGEQAATDWRRLLDALEQPTSPGRAASAALTAFVGWTAEELATADDAQREALQWRLHRWAAVLRRSGVAALLENVTVTQHMPARLLARPGGERQLTDIRHIGQLLHAASVAEGLGVTAVGAWLRRRMADATRDNGDEDRSRRLESDAEAVQVLTVHRAKGLEFPIVYCPYLWDQGKYEQRVVVFHDAAGVRTIDVGGPDGPDFPEHAAREEREERGEDLRLLYVALTRARHQAVVWWAGTATSQDSPLSRLLFARDDAGVVNYEGYKVATNDEVVARVTELAAAAGADISVELAEGEPAVPWQDHRRSAATLEVAAFDRHLDQRWSRTSYSGITADAHGPTVGSESDTATTTDEETLVTPDLAVAEPEEIGSTPLLLAGMRAGARVGTLVHRVLERIDFTAADLPFDLRNLLDAELARDSFDIGERGAVVAGLAAMINAPLGPLADGLRLRDIGAADRLDELVFELPLTGGDTPSGELGVADVAALLAAHLPNDDPLSGYPARLAEVGRGRTLRGYLTGSIDLVLRVGAQFVVCDYKTNWLGVADEPLSAWHYRPAALGAAMEEANYPLQAILYTVALHRYLRWRVPGYDPAVNLGGVLYLFARGMSPDLPLIDGQPTGVFAWRPPAALIVELSDLFDRGRSAA